MFVCSKRIVLGDTLDAYFEETNDVILRNLTMKEFLVGFQSLVYSSEYAFPRFFLLNVSVNAFFDEYFLQRRKVPLFLKFGQSDLEFLT